jgi:ABC-type transport system involved in cytochrome bd biosynthesis fused ATPase/permease subunit
MENWLIPLFSILITIMVYPALMAYIIVITGLGVYSWLIIALMLSPYVALWYIVVKRRMLNEFKLLMENKPLKWDVKQTLEEYKKLLRRK